MADYIQCRECGSTGPAGSHGICAECGSRYVEPCQPTEASDPIQYPSGSLAEYLDKNPDQYRVRKGIIRNYGKFESEPLAAAYFHAVGMEGFADRSGEDWEAFQLDDADRAAMSRAEGGSEYTSECDAWAVLWYFYSGAVSFATVSEQEMEHLEKMDGEQEEDA